MYKFGLHPPRLLRDRGVASLLGPDCVVYYDNFFDATHLGRVSDLLAARLKDDGLDELKVRAVILFGFFEALRAQVKKEEVLAPPSLQEPLMLECGYDEEKIAVGMSFQMLDPMDLKVEGFAGRVVKGASAIPFELLLSAVYQHSDHLVVRIDEARLKFEVISLLAIPGKLTFQKQPPTIVLESEAPPITGEKPAPIQAKQYVALADLDYHALLTEERGKIAPKTKFSTGEILARQDQEAGPDDSKVVVMAPPEEKKPEPKNLLKKVWPFKKKSESETVTPEKPKASADMVVRSGEAVPKFEPSDLKGMTQYLVSSLSSGGVSKLSESIQDKVRDLKKDPAAAAVTTWLESFTRDFNAEKARLVEVSNKAMQSIRLKEEELKKRERVFSEDARRKDEQLSQQEGLLSRTKEQLKQANQQIESIKAKNTAEDNGFRARFTTAQNTITAMKGEASKQNLKIEELKNLLDKAKSGGDAKAVEELKVLKAKQNDMIRQNLQLKSMNEQLSKRAAGKPERPGSSEDLEATKKKQAAEIARLKEELAQSERDAKTAKDALKTAQQMLAKTKKAS